MKYPITPVPAPRQTRSDAWKQRPCVMRYRAFKDEVRKHGVTVENGDYITFVLPIPKSKKRVKFGDPHMVKPDIDNLLKSLLDAIFENDSHIHILSIKKVYGESGTIIIERPTP